jgi:RNA polymerase sigma factor (sigma-70 family)
MFDTTITDLSDGDAFVRAYTEPIRAAFRSLGFVDADEAEDLTQDLLWRLMRRDLTEVRSRLSGPFRNWLYRCVRNEAIDALRRRSSRPARVDTFEVHLPVDPSRAGDEQAWSPDVLFALAVFNLTLRQVRRHWEEQGKPEVWRIFEELVLAPMIPGRVSKDRDELIAEFPGRKRQYLDNCCTSVKRTIERVLPAMIPPALTPFHNPEERFEEWLTILLGSGTSLCGQLHLAFGTDRPWDHAAGSDESIQLARRLADSPDEPRGGPPDEDLKDAENRVLLGIWMTMPLRWYLDPGMVDAVFGARPGQAGEPSIQDLMPPEDGGASRPEPLRALLEALKKFAKRVHHGVTPGPEGFEDEPSDRARRAYSMTSDVAQALYNLSWTVALVRCDAMIVSLSAAQLRKNLDWLLLRPWLDDRLRPVLREARHRLSTACSPPRGGRPGPPPGGSAPSPGTASPRRRGRSDRLPGRRSES